MFWKDGTIEVVWKIKYDEIKSRETDKGYFKSIGQEYWWVEFSQWIGDREGKESEEKFVQGAKKYLN